MLLTISLVISALVALNLLLLKFSVNKTYKPTQIGKKPIVLNPEKSITLANTESLAPTGS